MNIIEEDKIKIPKKRGRKPKKKSNDVKIIKKRGRKTNNKIIDFSNDSNIITNIIVHLPLKHNDVLKIIDTNNKELSEIDNLIIKLENNDTPIDKDLSPLFLDNIKKENIECEKCNILKDKIKYLEENNKINNKNFEYNIITRKIYDCSINIDKNFKKNDNIVCWWCCHKFDNYPLGIPEIINKNIFYIYGYFCSFNCMMAYNIDLNDYKIWNRQALIYQIKNIIDINNKIEIFSAPPRQLLNIFGGPYSIEEFRDKFYQLNYEYRHLLPPMISILSIIEESCKTNNNKINKPYICRNKPLPKQGFQY